MSSVRRTVLPTLPREHPDLAALRIGREQVNNLEPRLEDLGPDLLVLEARGRPVYRQPVGRLHRPKLIYWLAEHIEEPPQYPWPDRDRDRSTCLSCRSTPNEPFRRRQRDRPHCLVAEVLCNLEHQPPALVALRQGDLDGVVNLRQLTGWEPDINDRPDNLDDFSFRPLLLFAVS